MRSAFALLCCPPAVPAIPNVVVVPHIPKSPKVRALGSTGNSRASHMQWKQEISTVKMLHVDCMYRSRSNKAAVARARAQRPYLQIQQRPSTMESRRATRSDLRTPVVRPRPRSRTLGKSRDTLEGRKGEERRKRARHKTTRIKSTSSLLISLPVVFPPSVPMVLIPCP